MKLALSRKNLWDRTPRWGKRIIGAALGAVPTEYLLGGEFRRKFDWVRASERWSTEEARAYQLQELRRVLSIAERAPYYGELFSRVGFKPGEMRSVEELRKLPLSSRDTVQQNLERMCTSPAGASDVDYVTTGGTTGAPLRFYTTSGRHATEYAFLVCSWSRAGYRLGEPMAVLRGRKVAFDPGVGFHYEYEPLLRHHYYSNFHTSPADFDAYIAHMREQRPLFLHAYPSSAYQLARHARAKMQAVKFRAVLLESENVYPEQRRFIEEVFGCRCFSSYGHTEKLVAAAECEGSADYHVWPGYGYCEVVNAAGEPAAVGETGEIVGTGFINTLAPFVRYRTGDFAALVGQRCKACGREQMVLRDIRGHRVQESLVLADGSEVSWTALNMHDDTFDRVQRIQFVQERSGEAILRLVPESDFGEADARRILANLDAKLGGRMKITLEKVDAIAPSASGKAIYVDQRIGR